MVRSETVHGTIETSGGKVESFVYRAKPLRTVIRITRPDGRERAAGFDGSTAWALGRDGVSIDRDTAVEAVRRDADLQYSLHQPDYFREFGYAGVAEFEGHTCYWLHGTTNWGKG